MGKLKRYIKGKISIFIGKKYFSSEDVSIFNTISFELRSRCNSTCSFCAASIQNEIRPDRYIPKHTFIKVIDELGEINYQNRICFYINTEPLLDKRLSEFIRYARNSCPKAFLHVMTNGKSLNNKLGESFLIDGLDLLEINNYSDDGSIRSNINNFMEVVAPRYPGKVSLNMRELTEVLNNRGGSAPNGKVLQKPLKNFCVRPFLKLFINVDGVVGLCEHDFYFKHIMGNVNEKGIIDIWNSEEFTKVRKALIKGNREISPICSNCDFSGYQRISNPKVEYKGQNSADNKSIIENLIEKIDYGVDTYL